MFNNNMKFIDPHIHMTSRTTYDYLVMKEYGIVAVIEPSFSVRVTRRVPCSQAISRPCLSLVKPLELLLGFRKIVT